MQAISGKLPLWIGFIKFILANWNGVPVKADFTIYRNTMTGQAWEKYEGVYDDLVLAMGDGSIYSITWR